MDLREFPLWMRFWFVLAAVVIVGFPGSASSSE